MHFIGRLFVIAFAVILASLAAGIAIAVGVLGPQWHVMQADPGERVMFWGLAIVGSVFTGAISILPLAIAIAVAETFKIRSVLVNMAAGACFCSLGTTAAGSRVRPMKIDRLGPSADLARNAIGCRGRRGVRLRLLGTCRAQCGAMA